MRYLAILKDSLREARDSWVLLGLLALSTLVILFVAQLSFHPQSAEKTMAYFFGSGFGEPPTIMKALNSRKQEKFLVDRGEWFAFRLEKVEVVSGEPDSPASDYALTVATTNRHFGGPIEMPAIAIDEKNGGDRKKPVVDVAAEKARLRKLFEDADALGYIKIGTIEPVPAPNDKDARYYRVVLHSTPDTHRIWGTEPGLMFGLVRHEFFEIFAGPLAWQMYNLASKVIGIGSWIAVLFGVVITSFFFPNMLRKGTIDLLIVKPISRPLLLVYKYLGGLTFILLTTAYAIGGIWFVLGIRSGLWAHGTLLLIPSVTFFFAILYSVSTLVGVVTRSVVASILLTVGAWIVFWAVGVSYSIVDMVERIEKADTQRRELLKQEDRPADERWTGGWTFTIIKGIHAVSPRTEDMNQLNDLIIYTDFMSGNLFDMGKFDTSKRNWWECLFVSGAWIAFFLGLACVWFSLKDY